MLEAGASATLLDQSLSHDATALSTQNWLVELADGAALNLTRLQDAADAHKQIDVIEARVAENARLTANLMVGVPDYENYVAQQRKHNPNAPVMTELQFQDYCRKRRCGANGGRCC